MVDDDLRLLDLWCNGDTAAGNALFKRHFESIYRFFEHKTDSDIDDLVQETFLQCTSGRAAFRRQSTFRTYLFAIARHVLLHHWRKRSRGHAVDFDDMSIASLSTSVGSRLARSEERARLMTALREMPVEQQLLLEMYYWQDFDRGQLAEVFEVESATIGSRLTRARQALHAALASIGPAPSEPALDGWARSLAHADQ
jgi:RNA polymerase sigma factor (sigma-70 family)